MPALRDEIVAAEHEGVALRTGVRPTRGHARRRVVAPSTTRRRPSSCPPICSSSPSDRMSISRVSDVRAGKRRGPPDSVDPETGQTSHPRVFAGGDVVAGERTVTAAMAWGLRAAWGIDVALRGRESADRRAPPLPVSQDEAWRGYAAGLQAPKSARRSAPEANARERSGSFLEVGSTFTDPDARAEASRCLMCGLCGNCRACVDTLGCPALGMNAHGVVELRGAERASEASSGGGGTEPPSVVTVTASLCIGCGVCADMCSNEALGPRGRA